MSLRDLGLILLIMVIWGLNYPVGKIGVAAVPPMMMIALRFAVVAALILPFVPAPRAHMRRIFYLSIMIGVFHFAPNFTGLKLVDSGVGAILNQLSVPFSAILAAIFFKDRIGWRRMLGMGLAFAGVAVLVGEPKRPTDLLGAFLMIAASLAWAVSIIQTKFLKDVNPLSLVGWMTLMAAPQLAILSLLLEERPVAAALAMGWIGLWPILYMAIFVSIVSHTLWYGLVHRHPINVTAPFALLTPVFGVLFGVLILGEQFTWWMLAGGLITLAGVTIITIRRPAQAEPSPER
ncbi:MAG TPA: EamA family transporter [Alphaproteobacteria bacterium]|jgi:O-acetylserine/cysteine efflux transporter